MRLKKSIILPIISILAGVLFQLDTMGLTGNLIPSYVLENLWPLLLVAAGLDLLFTQRRLVAAVIMLFFGTALLSTQFLDSGWNNTLWQMFLKFWPILLILFGLDMIFSGHSLINAAVIITAALVLVLLVLTVLDIPVTGDLKLPIDLSRITSVIPEGEDIRSFFMDPVQPGIDEGTGADSAGIPQILNDPSGSISIGLPKQKQVSLEIRPVSGRISLKAEKTGKFLKGTVNLNPKEHLLTEVSLKGNTAVYKLGSDGKRDNTASSIWEMSIAPKRKTDLNVVLNDGYLKADLRGMTLTSVSLENKSGPLDVMTTSAAKAVIKVKAGKGDIRVYIPKGVFIECTVKGAAQFEYPQNNYVLSGNSMTPRRPAESPVQVEISSNRGSVRIIETE